MECGGQNQAGGDKMLGGRFCLHWKPDDLCSGMLYKKSDKGTQMGDATLDALHLEVITG